VEWKTDPCTFVSIIIKVISFAVRESIAVTAHASPLAGPSYGGCAGSS
jgi:hypothetical protein